MGCTDVAIEYIIRDRVSNGLRKSISIKLLYASAVTTNDSTSGDPEAGWSMFMNGFLISMVELQVLF